MKILLVGLGRWGSVFYRNLKEDPVLRLGGVVTSRPAALPPDFSGKHHSSLEEALGKESWDGIILATPPGLHAGQLEACVARKIPVLVEKPLTADLLAALRLRGSCTGASVLVDHIFLFHPAYELMKSEIGSQAVVRIESEGGNTGPFREDYSSLWDYGAHDVSIALDLMGCAPDRVSCRKTAADARGAAFAAELDFPGGRKCSFRVSNISERKFRRIRVETADSSYELEDSPSPSLTRINRADGKSPLPYPPKTPLRNLLSSFAEGIAGRPDARWGIERGIQVVEVLDSCERQLETGR